METAVKQASSKRQDRAKTKRCAHLDSTAQAGDLLRQLLVLNVGLLQAPVKLAQLRHHGGVLVLDRAGLAGQLRILVLHLTRLDCHLLDRVLPPRAHAAR